ncbi:MAG: hypothetical protein K2X90_01980 [Candidatus Babeliaceae bacterium]|nr:hypothetical protein [Candidatus Babeliaceae bacterium]
MILSALQYILRPIFGEFEKEEFKKFLRMGVIFALIIGSYWTLRVLKDSVFINLVSKHDIPWAKTASLILLFPLVMFYTKLMDRYSREKMFYILSTIYAGGALLFGLLLCKFQADAATIATYTGAEYYLTKVLGYVIYIFVESYGSLVVALFWAFASDTTDSNSAKKGFYLVTAIGQFGGIIGPMFITPIAQTLKQFENAANIPNLLNPFSAYLVSFAQFVPSYLKTTSAISFFVCALSISLVGILIRNFLKVTPKNLLASFHGKNEANIEKEQEPGFLEGLKLLLSHKYLMGIFAAIASYEIIVTIFDFNFKVLASTHYTGRALDAYLGQYGSYVNIISLICLLLGVSNITRLLGVGVALVMMPIIVAAAITGFITFDSLPFLFWLMVGSKAINYALNGPAMKQLYIPTTHDVRFKSQAWIEVFGSRGSKEVGSIFNMSLKPLQGAFGEIAGKAHYILMASVLGYGLVAIWFFVALYLGKTYKNAIDEKRVVC